MKGKEGDSKSETEKALQCRRKRLKNFNKNAGALSRSHSGSLCLCRVLSSERNLRTYLHILSYSPPRAGAALASSSSRSAPSPSLTLSLFLQGGREGRKEGADEESEGDRGGKARRSLSQSYGSLAILLTEQTTLSIMHK